MKQSIAVSMEAVSKIGVSSGGISAQRSLHVVVVDEELPYPLNSGKRIRTFNLIKHLASQHKITFLCHRNLDRDELEEAVTAFEEIHVRTIFLERTLPRQTLLTSKPALVAQLSANLFSRLPYLVQKHISRELLQRLHQIVARDQVDLVHFEWTPYAQAMPAATDKPCLIDAHNVESLIWQRYAEAERNPIKRLYIRSQWKKFVQFEKKMFARARRTVFVSQPDACLAASDFGCQRPVVVDNGVDIESFPFVELDRREDARLLFLGSLDWRPNTDAVVSMLDQVLPTIRRLIPRAHVDIVGRKPPTWLKERVAREEQVTLHCDVPNVRPYIERSGFLVVPLRIGGGSRLKILEAAASGLPIISTRVGAEGLDLQPMTHFLEVEDIGSIPQVLNHHLGDYSGLQQMCLSARSLAEQRYDWKGLAGRLGKTWSECVAESTS